MDMILVLSSRYCEGWKSRFSQTGYPMLGLALSAAAAAASSAATAAVGVHSLVGCRETETAIRMTP
jgi:hypothetical protein